MASEASTAPRRATKAKLARELQVSRQAIGDLVKRGILSEDKDGLVDVDLAKLAIQNRVRPNSKTGEALAKDAKPSAAAPQAPAPADGSQQITSFHVAKTLNEAALARMNQLRLKEMEGDLILVSAVEKLWAQRMSQTREVLQQSRSRLAPRLAAESDVRKIDDMLAAEHDAALRAMAGQQVAAMPVDQVAA